ncbi:hypothetical protein B5S31_g1291 [[Candida] boidinii]|nr:hypothetical protein B5S31_g1291 [[Candida] boidinii]
MPPRKSARTTRSQKAAAASAASSSAVDVPPVEEKEGGINMDEWEREQKYGKAPKPKTSPKTNSTSGEDSIEAKEPETLEELIEAEEELSTIGFIIAHIEFNALPNHIIQLVFLFFPVHLVYLMNQDKEEKIPYLYNCLFILIGVLVEFFVITNSAWQRYKKDRKLDEPLGYSPPKIPEFGSIYIVLISLIVCFIKYPEKLAVVGGCALQITDMALVPRVIISMIMSSQLILEYEHLNVIEIVLIPIIHAFVVYVLTEFGGKSIASYERHFFGILVVSLLFFVTPGASSQITLIFKFLFTSYSIGFLCASPFYELYKHFANDIVGSYIFLGITHGAFYVLGCISTFKLLTPWLGETPVEWLLKFIKQDSERQLIVQCWIAFSVILIPSVFTFARFLPLDIRRKIWHYAIFIAVAYPMIIQPELTSLALIGLFGVILIVEIQRSLKLRPFGAYLSSLFEPFEDKKDKEGPLVVSYIYLVIGILTPVLLEGCTGKGASIAGLVTSGLGDSTASILGKRLGSHKWPYSNKTYEGTFAFFITSVAAFYGFQYLGQNELSHNAILISSFITALIEGATDINDNLLSPAICYMCLLIVE